jgi:purine-nucleoside phosphorylase
MSTDHAIAARYLAARTNKRPEVLIVCGSGLSHLSESITDPLHVSYTEIPGFKTSTVHGHKGEMVFGTMDGIEVVCMRGRFHFYEGYEMEQVVFPIKVMRQLGCKLMIATNAAGGLNENWNIGDIICVQDHFGGGAAMFANNPLRGPNDANLGPRFFAISDCYDEALQSMVVDAAKDLGIKNKLRENGTYCYTVGPSYESIAECRFLRNSIGGDCVGMSTVPEVITAKYVGMKILCLSLVTNKVVTEKKKDTKHATHEEVLEAATTAGKHVQAIVESCLTQGKIGAYLKDLPEAPTPPPEQPLLNKSFVTSLVCAGAMFALAALKA